MNKPSNLHLAEIRELARRFNSEQIEACIQSTLESGHNPCFEDGDTEEVMNVLAKAEFVKSQMEQGMPLPEAIRELGRRIRAAQGDV